MRPVGQIAANLCDYWGAGPPAAWTVPESHARAKPAGESRYGEVMADTDEGPRRLAPDKILAQVPVDGPDGVHADGLVEIGPDHPQWEAWDKWLRDGEKKG